jgi:hypothetical protein
MSLTVNDQNTSQNLPRRVQRRQLTRRQRKFVEGKLQGKSSAAAARAAGYAESVALKANRLITRSPTVQAIFPDLLASCGASAELLAQRMREGLDAVAIRYFTHAGAVTDSRQVVDYAERRAMVELCLRVMGYLPAAKVEHHITLEEILAQSWEDKS